MPLKIDWVGPSENGPKGVETIARPCFRTVFLEGSRLRLPWALQATPLHRAKALCDLSTGTKRNRPDKRESEENENGIGIADARRLSSEAGEGRG